MTEVFTAYKNGMEKLLNLLGPDHDCYFDALILKTRLLENLDEAKYGTDKDCKAERVKIIDSLNRLAEKNVGQNFTDLCFPVEGQVDEAAQRSREDWSGDVPTREPERPTRQDPVVSSLGQTLQLLITLVPIWGWATSGTVLVLLAVALFSQGFGLWAEPEPTMTPTETAAPTATATVEPTLTSTPTPRATPTATPKPSPTWPPDVPPPNALLGDTWTRPVDEAVMVYVPAGEFEMGSTEAQFQEAVKQCVDGGRERDDCERWYEDEKPAYTVSMDGFWIDKHEVTNAQFAAFLNERGNQVEGGVTWMELNSDDCLIEKSSEEFHSKSGYADHPVVEVSWYGAKAYAEWVGGRLPSEAEWEYAARGSESSVYPWGDDVPTCDLVQYGDCSGKTVPVGSFPDGASWCGALDMAGNVWEWTQSLYEDYPYDPDDGREDLEASGPRLMRGGSFYYSAGFVRCAARLGVDPDLHWYDNGFRVVVAPFSPTSDLWGSPEGVSPSGRVAPTERRP